MVRYQSPLLKTLFSLLGPVFFRGVEQGAATQVFAACHPNAPKEAIQSQYLENCKTSWPSPVVNSASLQDRLWAETETILRQFEFGVDEVDDDE